MSAPTPVTWPAACGTPHPHVSAWRPGVDPSCIRPARHTGSHVTQTPAGTLCVWEGETPESVDVTVFELRTGTDDEPDHVAMYATEKGAAAHGEALYRAEHGTAADLEWRPIGAETEPSYRLVAVDDLDGEETDTDWHIVPVVVPAAYTPVGGAR